MATLEDRQAQRPAEREGRRPTPSLPPPVRLAMRREDVLLEGKLELSQDLRIDPAGYQMPGRLARAISSSDPSSALARALPKICRREGADEIVSVVTSLEAPDLGRFGHMFASALREVDRDASPGDRKLVLERLAPLARLFETSIGDSQSGEGCARALGAILKSKTAGPMHESAQELAAYCLLSEIQDSGARGECATAALVAWRSRETSVAHAAAQERLVEMLSGASSSLAAFAVAASAKVLAGAKHEECRARSEELMKALDERLPGLLSNLSKEADPSGSAYALCILMDSRDRDRRQRAGRSISCCAASKTEEGRALRAGYALDRPFFVEALSRATLRPMAEALGGRMEEDLLGSLLDDPRSFRKVASSRGQPSVDCLIDYLSAEYGSADPDARRSMESLLLERPKLIEWAAKSPLGRYGASSLAFEMAQNLAKDDLERAFRAMDVVLLALGSYGLPGDELIDLDERGALTGAWALSDFAEKVPERVDSNLERLSELAIARPASPGELHSICGIRNFGRYPKEILLDQAELMTSRTRPTGGIVAVFYPVGDYNGAFYEPKPLVQAYERAKELDAGLVVCECGGVHELLRRMLRIARRLGPIDVGIFGGHGTPHSLELDAGKKLDIRAIEGLKRTDLHGRLFVPQPSFLLFSCSTGKRWGIADRAASVLSSIGPTVSAPEKPAYLKDVDLRLWREDGRLVARVSFGPAGTRQYTGASWISSFLKAFAVPHV